jgi:hypothetical protein
MVKIFFKKKLDLTYALKLGTSRDADAENVTGGAKLVMRLPCRFPR